MLVLDDILEFLIIDWFKDSLTESSQVTSYKFISSWNVPCHKPEFCNAIRDSCWDAPAPAGYAELLEWIFPACPLVCSQTHL